MWAYRKFAFFDIWKFCFLVFWCTSWILTQVWYFNVPHTRLVEDKGGQNWMVKDKDKFKFPGGGTQFIHGADQYLDQISQVLYSVTSWHTHNKKDYCFFWYFSLIHLCICRWSLKLHLVNIPVLHWMLDVVLQALALTWCHEMSPHYQLPQKMSMRIKFSLR